MDAFIEPALRARIQAELNAIEREEAVRIPLAVESGSRAWGFPSTDSDYDVRFLYVRPIEAYLTVTPPRDVIERPIDATLDVNGWDLRKALQLMLRSNAVLIEWLTSPVRYRNWDGADELLALACSAASLTSLTYHYQHQAQRSFEAVGEGTSARLKSIATRCDPRSPSLGSANAARLHRWRSGHSSPGSRSQKHWSSRSAS
jgi:uncharacterized protein